MCLWWQGFFFVFFVFAFWYWASSSAFPSDLISLWQAGIVRLWCSSSSSSSSSCPVVDFVFGFLLRLSPSASSLPSSSPSSGFVLQWGFSVTLIWFRLHHFCDQNRIDAVFVWVFTSSSSSYSTHPLHLLHNCVLGVMFLIGDRCAVDLCLWAQEI